MARKGRKRHRVKEDQNMRKGERGKDGEKRKERISRKGR